MSGICAIWRRSGRDELEAGLESAAECLALKGVERLQTVQSASTGMCVAAQFDSQQVARHEHTLIACDADLTNIAELRKEFPPGPLTAILVALYRRHGDEFVERLAGGFAIVLWDEVKQRLLAAVDPFGVKRLVYHATRERLCVGSRIDAVLCTAHAAREINPTAIANVLNFGSNLAPETVFRGVLRIPPASILTASGETVSVRPYWDMRYRSARHASEKDLSLRLEQLVERSVHEHADDDPVRVGAFLSGGTDSSTIVGMLARSGRRPVKAFSIGFDEASFNELEYARIAADRFGAVHRTSLVGARDCLAALPGMVRAFDEPFANSSAIPTYFCAKLAAEDGVRVLLGGDGGDELFGGNEWYRTEKIFELYQRLPGVVRRGLIEPTLRGLPIRNGIVGKARSYVRRSNTPGIERTMSYHFLCANRQEEIFEDGFLEALNGHSVLETPRRYYRSAPAEDHMDRLLYVDVKITLGDSDLPKVTRMSELAGVQARFPFLCRPVAEFSGTIPPELKVKGLEKRYLFKRAFRNLLPPEIIAKKKHGFGIPVAVWLKSDPELRTHARDALLSRRSLERGYFRRVFVEGLFQKHEQDDTTYYGDTLWSLLMLELWHREYADL